MTTRLQWRFYWPNADEDMIGTRWRDEKPTKKELAEWEEDFITVWIEQRTVIETDPIRIEL